MDIGTALDLGTERARRALDEVIPPALMPLPNIPVSAETWDEDHHVRLHGEAIYALHRGGEAWWAIVVHESNALPPGCVRITPLSEIRCESPSSRRGG